MTSLRTSKVPEITLGFWIIKILSTTLGETAGDTLSMTFDVGYLISSAVFLLMLVLLISWQVSARRFHPWLYWATIIASTTAGTTMADFATRSLGIGYSGGSALLLACVLASLLLWYWRLGSISVRTVHEPRTEIYYWITITFSQTLGTALGDWAAGTNGLGYGGAALAFAVLLAVVAGLHFTTAINKALLFWAAFILTRPLGAAVGDFLDKPLDHGGLAFSRPLASLALAAVITVLIFLLPQRAAEKELASR